MMIELKRILLPFLIALMQVATAAVAIGMLPALWVLMRQGRYRALFCWTLVAAAVTTAAVYALPLAHREWKAVALQNFKVRAMWMGYFVGALFAPMLVPEPLRLARQQHRRDTPREHVRKVRRKRRKEGMPHDLKLR